MDEPIAGSLHHVELWVPDLGRAVQEWGWLLGRLGYESFQDWPDGRSWRLGGTYLVVEQSPALTAAEHERLRPGLNHLAFHAGPRDIVDELAADGPAHGWTLLFPDRHPYAGGPDHYAPTLPTRTISRSNLSPPSPDRRAAGHGLPGRGSLRLITKIVTQAKESA
jgi:catechol 2,3-dioxygenase-like lactoylglutathione lyase family enzyme